MLKWIDRGASALLVLFAAGHGFLGTLMSSPLLDSNTVWSFSGSMLAWLIAALNWMRAGRPGDRVVAFWALVGAVSWIGLMIWLMAAAQMWSDPRPWLFNVACAVLAGFGLRDLLRRSA